MQGRKGSGTEVKTFYVCLLSPHTGFQNKMCVCLPVAALILQIEHKQIVSASFFLVFAFSMETLFCMSGCPSLTPHCCSLSLSLSTAAHSFFPPIPSLSTPLTLPVPSSYPASQVTMTGGFLAPISWSFSTRLCVITRACAYVFMSVCVSPLSAELRPCPCLLAARSHPAADL